MELILAESDDKQLRHLAKILPMVGFANTPSSRKNERLMHSILQNTIR
jgi:hypothetical protein